MSRLCSAFKIYPADVGLLHRLAQLTPTRSERGNRLFTEFRGALTENYVLPYGDVLNIPLFKTDETERLIGVVLNER